jgi:hypothetical protein
MEFKHTSDVLPDYLERKDEMVSKQYENFMNILRKAKKPGWTSDQLNFIVGSKSINENVMDTNLERLGINQKNKKKIKAATAKTNIHRLLNILKPYYANTHQDSPKSTRSKIPHQVSTRRGKTRQTTILRGSIHLLDTSSELHRGVCPYQHQKAVLGKLSVFQT